MHFGAGKSATQAQHDTLVEFTPIRLSTDGTWRGSVADAKIRVYADDDYRAQNLKWQQTFGEQLEYANAVLGPQFGVRLVADYRVWNHHAPGNGLAADLEALRAGDPGTDVLTVIGLTSALSLTSATFDLLGIANEPGRHVMLRGYADLEERKAFARAFPDLTSDERDNALEARRRHKLAAVLLHELAHTLGSPHELITDTLMNPTYSEHATAFSPEAHAVIQRGFDQRLGRETHTDVAAAPPPPSPGVVTVHKILSVTIKAGSISVDEVTKTDTELTMTFRGEATLDKDTEVLLHADPGVPSSRVVEVLDRAKAAGLTKFNFR